MGMFDDIKYSAPCPACGATVTGWQSKSGPCTMALLEPWEVDYFYAPCPKCKTWIDAKVEAEVERIVHKCEVKLDVDMTNWHNRKQQEVLDSTPTNIRQDSGEAAVTR